MKQLLAVSWEMPPLSGPRAVQVTRTLQELSRHGWRSRVICFGPRSTRYNQDYHVTLDADAGVTLLQVPSPEEWFVFRALWRICPPVKRLPDEKRVWIPAALRAARLTLAAEPADLLVSFAQPWSDHLIGLRLHRETGLPWVAHFSDPWSDNPYARGAAWQRRIWRRMEHDVVAEATRIVFVNQHTADRVMAKYPPDWRHRVRVVPQGYDPAVASVSAPRRSGPLRMVYAGRFYDGVRTPDALFDALARIHRRTPLNGRLAVEIVGGAMDRYECRAGELGLAEIVSFSGRRSPEQAMAAAAAADVLLVIDAPSDGPSLFLPSKLIDYLPLAKPILGLTPADGPSAALIARLGYTAVDPSDASAIAAAIEGLLRLHEAGELRVSERHIPESHAYDIRETTRLLHRVLDEALSAA
jgi:glycosyltransferase involved in cell wall biosynthesis